MWQRTFFYCPSNSIPSIICLLDIILRVKSRSMVIQKIRRIPRPISKKYIIYMIIVLSTELIETFLAPTYTFFHFQGSHLLSVFLLFCNLQHASFENVSRCPGSGEEAFRSRHQRITCTPVRTLVPHQSRMTHSYEN